MPTPSEIASAKAIAHVRREIEEMRALDQVNAERRTERRPRPRTPSVVYSIRLDADEITTLERRAAYLGVKPTALARSLVRSGLARASSRDAVAAVDRLAADVEELRALIT